MTAVDGLIAGIAGHGLPAAVPQTWPQAPLDDVAWAGLLARVRKQRLTGTLSWAVEDGFPTTAAQRSGAHDAHAEVLGGCLHLERFLLEVSAELLADDIELRVLKGPAVARWAYPDPAVRTFGDIDLLIASADWDRALRILDASGLPGSYGEPRPGWASRFAKGDVCRSDEGLELDLHRTFVGGPLGLSLDLDAVLADPRWIELGGTSLPVLPPDTALLHACYNAALGDLPPRLMAARDVAQLMLCGSVDLDHVLHLARAARAESVVARAVRLTSDLLGVELPLARWADRHQPTAWERVALLAYTDPGRNTPRETTLGLLAVPGITAKVQYVWPLLFPQRPYLAERHPSRLSRFSYAARSLRGRARRRVSPGRPGSR
jgi:hypothetical protein